MPDHSALAEVMVRPFKMFCLKRTVSLQVGRQAERAESSWKRGQDSEWSTGTQREKGETMEVSQTASWRALEPQRCYRELWWADDTKYLSSQLSLTQLLLF